VRLDVADGDIFLRGLPISDGPPGWGLGEELKTPHRKSLTCYESHKSDRKLENLKRRQPRKRDGRT